MKQSRAEKAGRELANVIHEMVNLMYQKNTAYNFMMGLVEELVPIFDSMKWQKGGLR